MRRMVRGTRLVDVKRPEYDAPLKEAPIQTLTYGSGDRMFIDGEEVMPSVPDVTNMYSVERLAEEIVRQVKENRIRMCGGFKAHLVINDVR